MFPEEANLDKYLNTYDFVGLATDKNLHLRVIRT